MDSTIAHLLAQHIAERNTSEKEGRVMYIIAKDGERLRAGEIFIRPVAYAYTLGLALLTGNDDISFAVHWLDQTPMQHVRTNPVVPLRDIVLHSVSISLVTSRMRGLKQRMQQQVRLN